MSKLDNQARNILESNIDDVLKSPSVFEDTSKIMLQVLGIEPNLETTLSIVSGFLNGLIFGYYQIKEHRGMNEQEMLDFLTIMKRRVWEMRQAFIEARIDKGR